MPASNRSGLDISGNCPGKFEFGIVFEDLFNDFGAFVPVGWHDARR